MTVQELIKELNKRIKDKSKEICAFDESDIFRVEKYDDISDGTPFGIKEE